LPIPGHSSYKANLKLSYLGKKNKKK